MGKMEEDLGIIFVLAGNYIDRDVEAYPDKCMPSLPGGLLVGAVDRKGVASGQTPNTEDPNVFAPGVGLPPPDVGEPEETGSSFGKPEIGLYRVLDGTLTLLLLF